MKNTSKLAFAVIISLITISCNQNPPGNTGRDNIKITPMEVIKNQAFGDVILRVNKLDTKLKGFKTKAVNFNHPSIKKLRLEVRGLGISSTVSETKDWTPGTPVSFSLSVLA